MPVNGNQNITYEKFKLLLTWNFIMFIHKHINICAKDKTTQTTS